VETKQITVPELAKHLGVSIPRAQALVREGKIKGWKDSCGWLTTGAAVETYLAMRTTRWEKKTGTSRGDIVTRTHAHDDQPG
jgi:hypothetical protein